MTDIDAVKRFWEANPRGESKYEVGSREYFEEHRKVYVGDCFAGRLDESIFPADLARQKVLDLGCGPGFWTVELGRRGCGNLVAADLTARAIELAQLRCQVYGVEAEFRTENAERLSFPDGTFSHVNCQGVIHHTPDTYGCVREIARVLQPRGTACISVYYLNWVLRGWPVYRYFGAILAKLGARLEGRGRENIFAVSDVSEITRLYDGSENPIGKCYGTAHFKRLVQDSFEIERIFYHFFPARSLPVPLPKWMHRILDRNCPFMIYGFLRKV